MRSNKIEEYKRHLRLTKRQREVIIGLILGDGHLETQNGGMTYRLKIEHSVVQKKYVDMLYAEFSEWVGTKPVTRNKYSFGKKVVSYGFSTYSSGQLRFYGQQFYRSGSKIIPPIIKKLISPLSLAVWFMDDGSKKSPIHKSYVIHSLGFAKNDLKIIQRVLKEKFSLFVSIHRQYNGLRIYIPSESADKFKKLIEPYVIPSMRYKLD